MAAWKSLTEDPDALVQLLNKSLLYGVPEQMRPRALNELTEALAEIHNRRGRGEPKWLVRLRAKLAETAPGPESMAGTNRIHPERLKTWSNWHDWAPGPESMAGTMNQRADQADTRSDAELLRAYLDPAVDDDGVAFNTIYSRYREEVRQQLENEGLPPQEAEKRVGAVFIRALDREPEDLPASLREMLLGVAKEVAHNPDWTPF